MWKGGRRLKKHGRTTKPMILVLLVVLVMAGLGYRYYQSRRPREVAGTIPKQSVLTVGRGSLSKSVSSTGAITANRDLELAFDVGGRVKQVLAQTTQTVEQGTILAELDQTRQELAYLSAKRELELARFEAAPSVLKEKELAFRVAEADLQATSLTAPFTGFIAGVSVQEEEWVSSGTIIMRILDTSRLFLGVGVDEIDIRHVQIGQEAMISIDAYPELSLPGTVVEVGIVPDNQGQIVVFPVKIELTQLDPRVRVGMSAEAEIVVQRAENVIVVPLEAVTQGRGRSSVAVVQGETIQVVPVVTGLSDGFSIEIVEGLAEGDQILTSNPQLYRSLQGNDAGQRSPQTPFQPGYVGGMRR